MLSRFLAAVLSVLGRPLNPQQRDGVQAPSGDSLFLVAGPGSGKTTVLALRVLKLIFVDEAEPQSIIATTFTRKAAKELRSRILGWGDQIRASLLAAGLTPAIAERTRRLDLNTVWTGTMDSLVETVLGQYRAPGAQPPAVVEDFVASALMLRHGLFVAGRFRDRDLQNYLALIRGSVYGLSPAEKAGMLNDIRQRLIHDDVDLPSYLTSPGACGVCAPHPSAGIPIVGDALVGYEDFLRAQQIVDYASLEQWLLLELQAGNLDAFAETIQHVLVDEYQDTNLLQERIYFELATRAAGRGGSITVVGDDDQALYRFRGATVDLFRDFPSRVAAGTGVSTRTIFLNQNYRSTARIVGFCNTFVELDTGFQSARVPGKPRIRPARRAPSQVPILGMFRDDASDLAVDLANFIAAVFQGAGFTIPSGDVIRCNLDGDVGDCALLTFSPLEVKNGRDRLPRLLRQELNALASPLNVFNPRGTALADVLCIRQLCGLVLECIDPSSALQDATVTLPQNMAATLRSWRQDGLAYAASLPAPRGPALRAFLNAWRRRRPQSGGAWPNEVALAALVYKLVTWIPAMQEDVEGLVQLEVVLRTLTEAGRFSSYNAAIVFRDPRRYERSVRAALWEIFAPLAEGAIDIDEDLLETLPADRLNVLSIHQSKGLEFPLVIVDVGSDFRRNYAAQAFQRFPTDGGPTHRLEDELRTFSRSLARPGRTARDRAFDDLTRAYFVAFSRAQDVLLLVGLNSGLSGTVRHAALGWDRDGTWRWASGIPDLQLI